MAQQDELTVDDLKYEWPENILDYETKFMMGLTMNDLLGAVLPFIMVTALGPSGPMTLVLAAVAGLLGLLSIKKFDGLGGRGLIVYGIVRLIHAYRKPTVDLPIILPRSGYEAVDVQTWGGDTLMSMGGENSNGKGN